MAMSNAERQRKFRENRDKNLQKRQKYLLSERQRYQKGKETGKKCSTKVLPEREQRKLRRKWRKQKRELKKRQKAAKKIVEDLVTPPMSPDAPQLPREADSRQKKQQRKASNRQRAKCYRDNAVLHGELDSANKKIKMYKRMDRIKRQNKIDDTPRSKTRRQMRNIQTSTKTVRKTLLFHNALLDQMRTWYKEKKSKAKRDIATMLSGPILRKYQFKSAAWQTVGVIVNFYERDDVSRLITGIKRTVTYKKQTKQRRVLTDTLRHTYLTYISEGNATVSFTTFYRLRPFWVIFPKPSDRNTCLCKLCENTQFMVSALKAATAIESGSMEKLIEQITCNINSQACMHGNCSSCKTAQIPHDKATRDKETEWVQWVTKTEKRKFKTHKSEVEKEVSITVKQTYKGSVKDLVEWLCKSINKYKKHHYNIKNQYEHFRRRKQNLMNNECLIHVDFSENYVCKYSEEIQSVHFGASKKQLSLHTGVYYVGQEKHRTFCTVSENLQHGPGAIWAHLDPVLTQISETYPEVDTLEFFSDGPTAQYRQKANFFLLTTKPKDYGFVNTSWSYFEAGHGKGIPDAIGGALKRKADNCIKYGKDITSAEEFIKSVSDSVVDCFLIQDDDISKGISTVSSHRLQAVKGTMQLHQVCSVSEGVVSYRDVSCSCISPNECESHKLKIANISLSKGQTKSQNGAIGATSKPDTKTEDSEKRSYNMNKRRKLQPERNKYDDILNQMKMCKNYAMLQRKCEAIEKGLEPMIKVSEPVSFTTQPLEPDVEAMDMIPSDLPDPRPLYPCQVVTDGNCLPSCGSVHGFGSTSETSEIRARIVLELVLNEERYLNSEYLSRGTEQNPGKLKNWPFLYTQYSDVFVPGIHLSDEIVQYFYRCEVLKVRKDNSFMGMWQLHALAEVLNMPVYSVYPQLGAPCVRSDYNRLLLPSTEERCLDTPAYILWTSTRVDMKKEHWVPNHFVPLLPIEPTDIGVVRKSPGGGNGEKIGGSSEDGDGKGDGMDGSSEGGDGKGDGKGDGMDGSSEGGDGTGDEMDGSSDGGDGNGEEMGGSSKGEDGTGEEMDGSSEGGDGTLEEMDGSSEVGDGNGEEMDGSSQGGGGNEEEMDGSSEGSGWKGGEMDGSSEGGNGEEMDGGSEGVGGNGEEMDGGSEGEDGNGDELGVGSEGEDGNGEEMDGGSEVEDGNGEEMDGSSEGGDGNGDNGLDLDKIVVESSQNCRGKKDDIPYVLE